MKDDRIIHILFLSCLHLLAIDLFIFEFRTSEKDRYNHLSIFRRQRIFYTLNQIKLDMQKYKRLKCPSFSQGTSHKPTINQCSISSTYISRTGVKKANRQIFRKRERERERRKKCEDEIELFPLSSID